MNGEHWSILFTELSKCKREHGHGADQGGGAEKWPCCCIPLQAVQPHRPAMSRFHPLMINVVVERVPSYQALNNGNSSEGGAAEIPMTFLLLWDYRPSSYGHRLSPCAGPTHFLSTEESKREEESGLTFSRLLAKFFGFTCSMLPRMGRGANPGGIFPLPDLSLHAEKGSRQAMQPRRTTVAAPSSSICFRSSGGSDSGCRSLSLYTVRLC